LKKRKVNSYQEPPRTSLDNDIARIKQLVAQIIKKFKRSFWNCQLYRVLNWIKMNLEML